MFWRLNTDPVTELLPDSGAGQTKVSGGPQSQ